MIQTIQIYFNTRNTGLNKIFIFFYRRTEWTVGHTSYILVTRDAGCASLRGLRCKRLQTPFFGFVFFLDGLD